MALPQTAHTVALDTRNRVMAELRVTDYTTTDMAQFLGLHRNTVDYHLRRAVREKRAHIFDWDRKVGVQGDFSAIYRFGPGENKKKPNRLSDKQYSARYWKKNKGVLIARAAAKRGKLTPYSQLIQN
jgi:hypothetical protein